MSLRERLPQRARTTDTWPLRIDDPSEALAALESVETAWRLALVAYGPDAPEVASAVTQLEQARQAVAACYEPIPLEALAPPDFEALAAKHPTDEVDRDGKPKAWDDDFPRELFLACVRSDLQPEEWLQVLGEKPSDSGEDTGAPSWPVLTEGEKNDLFNTVIRLNLRVPDPRLPKGWMPTSS